MQHRNSAEFNLTRCKLNLCFDGADDYWNSILETKLRNTSGSPRHDICASIDGPFGGGFGSTASPSPPNLSHGLYPIVK